VTTTSAGDTDLDTTWLEDVQFDLACDLADIGCPDPATWSNIARCCAFTFLFCEDHQEAMFSGLPKVSGIVCAVCQTASIPATAYIIHSERI